MREKSMSEKRWVKNMSEKLMGEKRWVKKHG